MSIVSGSCLCQQVVFQCKNDFTQFHLCHCTQCQKATGSAHASNAFTVASNITWLKGLDLVKRYDVPNRAIATAFCAECGSNLPFLSGAFLIVPVGCLDNAPNIEVQDNIFCDEKAPWYDKAQQAQQFSTFPK